MNTQTVHVFTRHGLGEGSSVPDIIEAMSAAGKVISR
jgi:hypothetical protein